jgi:phosphate transport system permease protein
MSAITTIPDVAFDDEPQAPRKITATPGIGDRIFRRLALASGLVVLGIMAAVGLFLGSEALDALGDVGWGFLTIAEWQPDRGEFGIAAVMLGTVLIASVAVAVAFPISLGTSLFIVEVAPARMRQTLVAILDLMAAVPSVVYGLWGAYFLQDKIIGISRWLTTWFGWIPIFKVEGADPSSPITNSTVFTASTFIAGLVVALMVIPIQTSIMREVFSQVPPGEREGAFALGASRWGRCSGSAGPSARPSPSTSSSRRASTSTSTSSRRAATRCRASSPCVSGSPPASGCPRSWPRASLCSS